jgi:S-layer homology domain
MKALHPQLIIKNLVTNARSIFLASLLMAGTILSAHPATAKSIASATTRPQTTTPATDRRLAQVTLSDTSGSWAEPFIQALAQRGIVVGYPDGTYRPDQLVTRAEFAAMLNKAFALESTRADKTFTDVPPNYWAASAISRAYQAGFIAGYPNNTFAPNQNILRIDSLVSLVNGSKLRPEGTAINIDELFTDAGQVPGYGREALVAGTQKCVAVSVSYPSGKTFNPSVAATRADVAAFVHQVLVATGRIEKLAAGSPAQQYVVNCAGPGTVATNPADLSLPTPPPLAPTTTTVGSSSVNAPVSSVVTPNGFGADLGQFFVTAGYQDRIPGTGFGAGLGIGDAKNFIGAEASYSTSSGNGNNLFDRGAGNFKVHKLIGDNVAIAAGWENAIRQNLPAGTSNTFYGVLSGVLPVGSSSNFTASVGAGNGRFRTFNDVNNNVDSTNLFGSLGFRATENIGVVADWDGNAINLGLPLTLKVGDGFGLQVVPSLLNVSGFNGTPQNQFGLGGGIGIRF